MEHFVPFDYNNYETTFVIVVYSLSQVITHHENSSQLKCHNKFSRKVIYYDIIGIQFIQVLFCCQ